MMQWMMGHGVPWLAVAALMVLQSAVRIRVGGVSLLTWQQERLGSNYVSPLAHFLTVLGLLLIGTFRATRLGITWGHWTPAPLVVFGLTLVVFPMTIVMSNYRAARDWRPRLPGWSLTLCVGLFAPIGEELFWRGYLVPAVGLWGSAVAFGVVHAFNPGSVGQRAGNVIYAGVLGLIFGYLRLETGGIIAGIILHSVVNNINHLTSGSTTDAAAKAS